MWSRHEWRGSEGGLGPPSELESGGLGPESSGGLLSYQGDSCGAGRDGQASLHGVLGLAQGVQRVPLADSQVGNDLVKLAVEWREGRGSPGSGWSIVSGGMNGKRIVM